MSTVTVADNSSGKRQQKKKVNEISENEIDGEKVKARESKSLNYFTRTTPHIYVVYSLQR